MPRVSTAGEQTQANAATNGKPKDTEVIGVRVPKAFYDQLSEKAKAADPPTSVVALARQTLADAFGYTLPPTTTRRKFASEAEKKAAQAASQAKRREEMAAALAALKNGAIKIVDGKIIVSAAEGTTIDVPEPQHREKAQTAQTEAPAAATA